MLAMGVASVFFLYFFRGRAFVKWVILWFCVTTAAFLSREVLIFTCVLGFVGLSMKKLLPAERVAAYCVLLPAIPPYFGYEIPGLIPGIRYWFVLNYPRILALTLLLPVFIRIVRSPHYPKKKMFSLGADLPVFLYLMLGATLFFRAPSSTEAIRNCALLLLDTFLLYYVVSRTVQKAEELNKIFLAILFSAVMLSFLGILEETKRWTFYNHLEEALGLMSGGLGHPLGRSGIFRINGTFGHPIAFGFFLVIGIGSLIYLWEKETKKKPLWCVCLALLTLALVLTVSRGPWCGAAVLFMVWFLLLRPGKKTRIAVALAGGLIFLIPFLAATSPGKKILGVLPYVGTQEQESVAFREDLLASGIETVKKNPWFGSTDFYESEEMKKLEAGGLIDITNTFLGVALNFGLVGLSLFFLIFAVVLKSVFRWMVRAKEAGREALAAQGRIIFSLLIAILVILGTVSSISVIPHYYWLVIALGAAYANVAKKELLRT